MAEPKRKLQAPLALAADSPIFMSHTRTRGTSCVLTPRLLDYISEHPGTAECLGFDELGALQEGKWASSGNEAAD